MFLVHGRVFVNRSRLIIKNSPDLDKKKVGYPMDTRIWSDIRWIRYGYSFSGIFRVWIGFGFVLNFRVWIWILPYPSLSDPNAIPTNYNKESCREGKEEWVPFDTSSYCSTSAFDAASPILYEILASLESLNIPVDQLHAESGNGQYEIVMGYTACSSAADNLIFTREVIRAVARKHGLLATFVPKYALDEIGSGSHVHISLSQNGKNVFMASEECSRYGMSKLGEEFLSGVLNHLPSILAFTAPIPNSYDRLQPHMWSGAYQCWGMENKEAPLRTASPPGVPDGFVSNFEIKAIDGCANPYLALSSIIASGIDGLRRHLDLPEPTNEDPQDGKVKRLPQSLSESVKALEKDSVMGKLIGEKLVLAVKGVRKAEIKYYSQNKDAYKKLIHRY